MDSGVERIMQAFDSLVSGLATRPDGAAWRSDLDTVEAALAGRYEGTVAQAAEAALRLALLAASFETAEMCWLAWALSALAEDWMRQEGGA